MRSGLLAPTLFGLLLSACSVGNELPPLPGGTIPRISRDKDIQLPLDAHFLTPSQFAVYQNSLDRAIAACMQRKGFAFDVPLRPVEASQPLHNRRYGLTDSDHAKTYGYQPLPFSEAEAASIQRRTELEHELSAAAVQALTGGGDQGAIEVDQPRPTEGAGCYGEAVGALGTQDLDRNRAFLEELRAESYSRSKADPRVQDAFRAWSTCMSQAGFAYSDPFEANDDRKWARPNPSPEVFVIKPSPISADDPEVSVATKDVECNQKANVAGTWMAVETAYQLKLVEAHQEELARIEADLAELLRTLGIRP